MGATVVALLALVLFSISTIAARRAWERVDSELGFTVAMLIDAFVLCRRRPALTAGAPSRSSPLRLHTASIGQRRSQNAEGLGHRTHHERLRAHLRE